MSQSENSLLSDWVDEQKMRLKRMLSQLNAVPHISSENLELLGENLEDIDFHCAALSNILDMIVEPPLEIIEQDERNEMDERNEEYDKAEKTKVEKYKKWHLLEALWFHMMMITDPDSIYYSKNICSDDWAALEMT